MWSENSLTLFGTMPWRRSADILPRCVMPALPSPDAVAFAASLLPRSEG